MYAWRENNNHKEFFVLHRKGGDNVILTGHVADTILDETLIEAAKREIEEELGVTPIDIVDLEYKTEVILASHQKTSTEHAFLICIPNQDVQFLEGDEKHQWHSLDELETVLSYPNQRGAVEKIKNYFKTK
jgi:8-oxo-dGTP pyrophosphatase MutT (NUDIX family)